MYNVYLDDILQSEDDVLNINQAFEVGIIREDGFASTEQILREKSDAQLGFKGEAYRYIVNKRKTAICDNILCTVTYDCGDGTQYIIFEGYISQDSVELEVTKCLAKVTAIKDNSFSGLFRDYIDNEVAIYANRSKGCVTITQPERTLTIYDDPANLASTKSITAFDAFDVLNYIVQYFTDGVVTVRSDFLTGVTNGGKRYAITTGYNMHNTTATVQEKYPTLSFSGLFNELRKKTRIYMVVEYDDDVPYLRIEQEDYSYASANTTLEITDTPYGTIEKIDYNRFFNSVKVGSTNTDLQDGSTEYYSNGELVSWLEEVFNSCSNCSADKDSEGVTLDLVSDYIIDSNVIYEAAQQVDGVDYANDESIFLIEYEVDPADNSSAAIITNQGGDNIYNDGLRNENVINEWLGYTPLCISLTNTTTNYFLARRDYDAIATGTFPDADFEFALRFNNEIIDVAGNYLYPYLLSGLPVSQFIAPQAGEYRFKIRQETYISSLDCLNSEDSSIYQLGIQLRDSSDNLLAEFLSNEESHPNFSENIALEFISPSISMQSTDYVYPFIRVQQSANCGSPGAEFILINGSFELYDEPNGCTVAESNQEVKPFIIEFDYPLCHSDYLTIKNEKRGKIVVNGRDYFIKELKYVPRKVSRFTLIGSESIADDCVTS